MKFTIAYLGPEWLFHLRRDFILVLKYSLEDLGHTVNLAGASIDTNSINLIIGAYFLKSEQLKELAKSNIKYINVNTEVISNNMLNYNPDKVDFIGDYLPLMKNGISRWDVILDNITEYNKFGTKAHFLRWGYHPKLEDINHRSKKDIDFYFFGMLSPRRIKIIEKLHSYGLIGFVDHSCPYFLRNDRISRSKINLNLIQDDKYSHVNSFRICYLANNYCHIISENESDPAGYLNFAQITKIEDIVECIFDSLSSNNWKTKGIISTDLFKKITMNSIISELIDKTFHH